MRSFKWSWKCHVTIASHLAATSSKQHEERPKERAAIEHLPTSAAYMHAAPTMPVWRRLCIQLANHTDRSSGASKARTVPHGLLVGLLSLYWTPWINWEGIVCVRQFVVILRSRDICGYMDCMWESWRRYCCIYNVSEWLKFNGILNNSLWPSDNIWHGITWSTLVQVMAWCLMAPSHCLNQCWLIISEVLWQPPEGNFTKDIPQLPINKISLKITCLKF